MPQLEDLDSDEPLPRRIQRHDFDRLIMLSDGVFAIAITLAAIEVRLPAGSVDQVVRASFPVLMAYAISFTVIAAFWGAHRRLMARLARVDRQETLLNLLVLGLVALIPAATRMIVTLQIREQDGYLLYLALIAACGVGLGACWVYAALTPGLLSPGVSRAFAVWQAGFAIATPVATSSVAIAFIRHTSWTTAGLMLAVVFVLRSSRRAINRRYPDA